MNINRYRYIIVPKGYKKIMKDKTVLKDYSP